MGNIIRAEVSENNPYWIEKHRYYELKHFCLQYPTWKRNYVMLSDVFELDMWFPEYSIRNPEFEKSSYSVWALKELTEYVSQKVYPRKEVAVDEIIVLTNEFRNKMRRYAQIRQDNNFMFVVAQDILSDVLDVLRATK